MKWLVTGGAGFIGCNIVKKLMKLGSEVIIFDNLSRKGADVNLNWLVDQGKFDFVKGDIRNFEQIKNVFQKHRDIEVVLHLAAQVAVTTSIFNPREDFEVNALGTFNLLESVRQYKPDAIFLYASTNKVYGEMKDLRIEEVNGRYTFVSLPDGVSEIYPLDFHSPYGCSKGSADQYVIDYSRIYKLRSVSLRQSCVYGYHQFGVEEQGWVAWFIINTILSRLITIYGDGKQVRDILFIDDLVDAYLATIKYIDIAKGNAYNIGGGSDNTISLLELLILLERIANRKLMYVFSDWRSGDQKVFVSDIEKAKKDLNWKPKITKEKGIELLYRWVEENKMIFNQL